MQSALRFARINSRSCRCCSRRPSSLLIASQKPCLPGEKSMRPRSSPAWFNMRFAPVSASLAERAPLCRRKTPFRQAPLRTRRTVQAPFWIVLNSNLFGLLRRNRAKPADGYRMWDLCKISVKNRSAYRHLRSDITDEPRKEQRGYGRRGLIRNDVRMPFPACHPRNAMIGCFRN